MDKILETLKGLLQKGNAMLGKLPFKGLAEKYIPAGAKEKVPFLETFVTPYANQIAAGLVALLLVAAVGGAGGGGGSGSSLKGSTWEGERTSGIDLFGLTGGTTYKPPAVSQYTYIFDTNTVKRNYVEFNKQGNRVNPNSRTGSYILDGNKVFMTFDYGIEEGTIEGSTLKIEGSVYHGNIVFKPGKSSGINRSALETNNRTSNSEADYTVTLTSDNAGVIIDKYTGTASRVNIPAKIQGMPVREISWGTFSGNNVITRVTIPEGVTSIGGQAFYNCRNLNSVTLPNTLRSIGDSAFSSCSSLTSISLPAGLMELGWAFDNSGLTSFPNPWPKAITVINGFGDTKISGTLIIPEGITKIGSSAFTRTQITSLTLPSTIIEIGNSAFNDCSSLTTVNIPASISKIEFGSFTFSGCDNLNLASQARIKELQGEQKFEVNPSNNGRQ